MLQGKNIEMKEVEGKKITVKEVNRTQASKGKSRMEEVDEKEWNGSRSN